MNPTTDVLENASRPCLADRAVCTASGQAAVFYAICNITSAGQNFVTGSNLYGGTHTMFTSPLKRFGIEARFVDSSKPENFAKAIDKNTRLLYTESIGNPKGNVDDFRPSPTSAHKHNIPLVVDNTVTPPPLFNPFDHGADIVCYSLTKLIGGHGTSMGGCVIEKGDFDWKTAGKFPEITEPDPSYHGVNFWDAFGHHDKAVAPGLAYVLKIRTGLLRDLAPAFRRLTPGRSCRASRRFRCVPGPCRQCSEGGRVALQAPARLVGQLPGPARSSGLRPPRSTCPTAAGAILGFGIKGGLEAGKKFIDSVKLASHLANILDAKTLVIHPASTTHQQLTEAEQAKAGVTPDFIRVSVGIEDVNDIIADLDQVLRASQG